MSERTRESIKAEIKSLTQEIQAEQEQYRELKEELEYLEQNIMFKALILKVRRDELEKDQKKMTDFVRD